MSACLPATGPMPGSYGMALSPQPPTEADLQMVEQVLADRPGPRVSIRAAFESRSGTRRLRGMFSLNDDAYVLVGHIDALGVLRIVFPTQPDNDGFVRGSHTYKTPEVEVGFEQAYHIRAAGMFTRVSAFDSYDNGSGYLFAIASWHPMDFDQLKTDGAWDSFELNDLSSMNNPRPALRELAALLTGSTAESYTLEFAHYFNSQPLYTGPFGFRSLAYSQFTSSPCLGYTNLGFTRVLWYPFGNSAFFGDPYSFTGDPLSYGIRSFDPYNACYRRHSYRQSYTVARGLGRTTPPSRPRLVDPEAHRTPLTPVGSGVATLPVLGGEPDAPIVEVTAQQPPEPGSVEATRPSLPSVPIAGRTIDSRTEARIRTRPMPQDVATRHRLTPSSANDGEAGSPWLRIERLDNGSVSRSPLPRARDWASEQFQIQNPDAAHNADPGRRFREAPQPRNERSGRDRSVNDRSDRSSRRESTRPSVSARDRSGGARSAPKVSASRPSSSRPSASRPSRPSTSRPSKPSTSRSSHPSRPSHPSVSRPSRSSSSTSSKPSSSSGRSKIRPDS